MLNDLKQPAKNWLADAIENLSGLLGDGEDPSFVLHAFGASIEIRLIKLPEAATFEQKLAFARQAAHEKLREAEKAWYEYFGMCEVGPDRERAAQVYETVRQARRWRGH